MTDVPHHQRMIVAARDEIHDLMQGVPYDVDAPIITTVSEMMALSASDASIGMIEAMAVPDVGSIPEFPEDSVAATILREIGRCSDALVTGRGSTEFDASVYVDRTRFASFAASIAGETEGLEAINRLADLIGRTIASVSDMQSRLSGEHYANVLSRDLGLDRKDQPYRVGEVARWALCLHLEGSPLRADAMLRRVQALESYGLVSCHLRTPAITEIIDRGDRLAPVLCDALGIDAARLRIITRAQPIAATLRGQEKAATIQELLAYEIPSHEWPRDWSDFTFGSAHHQTLVSPKLISGQESVDALNAFSTDVLKPIIKERIERLELAPDRMGDLSSFQSRLCFPARLRNSAARREFHRGMTAAIFGERKAKAFHEGAEIWHRRAACAAALRKEMLAENPHWPALCDVWTSKDGRITAVPLTTAEDLVREGNFHNHCVGGYYEQCRSGRTHIVSMRRDGVPVGTLELLSVFVGGKLDHLTPGQFEATHRAKPDEDVQIAAKTFLSDLEEAHPVNRKAIQKHARMMMRLHDDGWSEQIMTMDHAGRTWPLYRPLMPRPFVEDLRQWMERSGLVETIDAALVAIAGKKPVELGMAA